MANEFSEFCDTEEEAGQLWDALFLNCFMTKDREFIGVDMNTAEEKSVRCLIHHEKVIETHQILGDRLDYDLEQLVTMAESMIDDTGNPIVDSDGMFKNLTYFETNKDSKYYANILKRDEFIRWLTTKEKRRKSKEENKNKRDAAPAKKITWWDRIITVGLTLLTLFVGNVIFGSE